MWHFNGAWEILNCYYYTVLYSIIQHCASMMVESCDSSFNMCGADLRYSKTRFVGQRKSSVSSAVENVFENMAEERSLLVRNKGAPTKWPFINIRINRETVIHDE